MILGFMMLSTEPEGYAEAKDGTLVHFIDLDLHAEALHNEVNDPVVLIHGLGCNWHHYSRQIGWLAQARRVVAVDMRGGAGKTRWRTPAPTSKARGTIQHGKTSTSSASNLRPLSRNACGWTRAPMSASSADPRE